MSRLVIPSIGEGRSTASLPPDDPRKRPDDLTDRVAKYVPVESVGFFVAIKAAVEGVAPTEARAYLIGAAVLCLVLSPVYFVAGFKDRSRVVRATHAVISVFAFAVWAYALAGDRMVPELYKPVIAAILLPAFSYLVGAIAKLTGEY